MLALCAPVGFAVLFFGGRPFGAPGMRNAARVRAVEASEDERAPLKTRDTDSSHAARGDEFIGAEREVAMDMTNVATRVPRFVSRGRSVRGGSPKTANIDDDDDDTF